MVYRELITLGLLMLTSGCIFARNSAIINQHSPVSMKDIYAQSAGDAQNDVSTFVQENLREQKTSGYVKPYIPVIQQPVVQKIWIPDHKSQDDAQILIGGHWVYLMLEGPKWFVDEESRNVQIPVIVPGVPMQGGK